MAMRNTAQLASLSLPPQFSYTPYIPRKRISITATAKAVVTQSSNPVIVHGDGSIPWSIKAAYLNEFQSLLDIYNEATLTDLVFLGYWGETLVVHFNVFDQPKIQGRLCDLSGQFQVVSVTVPQNVSCAGATVDVIFDEFGVPILEE